MDKSLRFLKNVIDTRAAQTDKKPAIPSYGYRGSDTKPPSVSTGADHTTLKETVMYTGTKMLGISTLHKSNAIPVFSEEEIIDHAKMRR